MTIKISPDNHSLQGWLPGLEVDHRKRAYMIPASLPIQRTGQTTQSIQKTQLGMAKAPKLLGPPPPPKLLLAFLPPPARNIPRQARLFSADGFKLIFYSSRNLGRRLSRSIGGLQGKVQTGQSSS
eukprot:1157716-Pelagomonas_calceolata.AAC.8